MSAILNWNEVYQTGPALCGGKGWNLARLHHAGFKVPAGGVLTIDVYNDLVKHDAIKTQIESIRAIATKRLNTDEAANKINALHNAIKSLSFPAHTEAQLHSFLEQQNLNGQALAIRSSATLEDGDTASFAGIHDSFLNVKGMEAIKNAILACFASLWSTRAISYRRKLNIADDSISIAVVINALIHAKSSGIAFSCDPATGRSDLSLINANFGYGESVVAGSTDPDQFYVDRYTQRVTRQHVGRKDKTTQIKAEGGTELLSLTPMQNSVSLTEEQVLKLAHLIERVFHSLGESEHHQDIEWIFDGQQFILVQTRPVTALPVYTTEGLNGQKQYWSNGNLRDAIPMVIPPLFRPFLKFHIDHILIKAIETIGYRFPEGISYSKCYQGRYYCNASLMQWGWYDAAGVEPKYTNLNLGGHQDEIHIDKKRHATLWKKLQRFYRVIKFLRQVNDYKKRQNEIYKNARSDIEQFLAVDLTSLSNEALITQFHIIDRKVTEFDTPFIIMACASGALMTVAQILEKKFGDEALAIANALITGEGDITSANHGYQLYDIAEILQSDQEALTLINKAGFSANDWQTLPDTSPFKIAFQKFIEEYGHRAIYEIDLSRPRWYEDPSYFLELIKNFPAKTELDEIKQRQIQQTEAAWQKIDQAYPKFMRKQIRSLAKRAAEGAACKETAKSVYVHFLLPLRKIALEIGRRLHQRHLISNIDDVFYCNWHEVESILQNEWQPQTLKALVSERKERIAQLEKQAAPDVIIDDRPSYALPQSTDNEHVLKGIPVSPGASQGVAFVACTPEQGMKIKHGDILVAPSTDPAWTPLFLHASALAMETGGFLSHGSIVAREYGIPAVVNIPGIVSKVKTGETIKVDGHQGTVEVQQ